MADNERDFKGVWISKEVWLDKRLNALDKIILTEIDSLDSSDRGCWASNKYIAEFCQCSETKVSTAISKLIEYDYLYIKSFDGRIRELKSRLSNFERQDFKNSKAEFQTLKVSNKDNNTKINKEDIKYIVDYLNQKAGTNYRDTTQSTVRLISALLNCKKPFTVEDFKTVIDNKCAEWLNTDMSKYLRPETLFGTKFEGYLNAKSAPAKNVGTNGIAVNTGSDPDIF